MKAYAHSNNSTWVYLTVLFTIAKKMGKEILPTLCPFLGPGSSYALTFKNMHFLFLFPFLLPIKTYRDVETLDGTGHTVITWQALIILEELFIIVSLLVFCLFVCLQRKSLTNCSSLQLNMTSR